MKLVLIEVVTSEDGKGYVVEPSCLAMYPITSEPLNAKNYADNNRELISDLHSLVLPDDKGYAKSGLRVQSIEVVELELVIEVTEISRRVGREPV